MNLLFVCCRFDRKGASLKTWNDLGRLFLFFSHINTCWWSSGSQHTQSRRQGQLHTIMKGWISVGLGTISIHFFKSSHARFKWKVQTASAKDHLPFWIHLGPYGCSNLFNITSVETCWNRDIGVISRPWLRRLTAQLTLISRGVQMSSPCASAWHKKSRLAVDLQIANYNILQWRSMKLGTAARRSTMEHQAPARRAVRKGWSYLLLSTTNYYYLLSILQ